MDDVKLDGKTVIVTGSNSGIGRETARELARRGARVILACRNLGRAEAARDDITGSTGNHQVIVKQLDLASFKSIKDFADDFNHSEERLDILVNSAGVMSRDRQLTEDGFELTFGVNHLGHFLLTYLVLDKLKASAPSRIVTVSSEGHRWEVDFKDLQSTSYSSFKAYSRSKSANVLHSVHLAKLLAGSGVTTYSLHPGVVKTELGRDYDENSCFQCLFRLAMCITCQKMISPAEGAKTSLYCCLEPSIARHTGRYYSKCRESRASSCATDEQRAAKLWDLSMEMCGFGATRPVVDS